MTIATKTSLIFTSSPIVNAPATKLRFAKRLRKTTLALAPVKSTDASRTLSHTFDATVKPDEHAFTNGSILHTNVVWHKCSVEKIERQELLDQKGCVIWITGLSGSGKSTVACALTRALHAQGKLTYILDGDNVRHGHNRDLTFKAEDRAENIRRIGEVAKLFAMPVDPYFRMEAFMDIPLSVCEARDPKGLYKLARAGKIKGFTGINDPYEAPLNSEIVIQQVEVCPPPEAMAEIVISYLEGKGYLHSYRATRCCKDKF